MLIGTGCDEVQNGGSSRYDESLERGVVTRYFGPRHSDSNVLARSA